MRRPVDIETVRVPATGGAVRLTAVIWVTHLPLFFEVAALDSLFQRLRVLWTFRWRKIPLTMVAAAAVLVGSAGVATVLAVGETTAPKSSVSAAADELADSAKGGRADAPTAAEKKSAVQKSARTLATERKRAAAQDSARKRALLQANRNKRAAALGWALPLRSYHLTGRFGANGNNWSSSHHGLDFAAPSGSPIRAVGPGTIVESGWDGAYGNHLKVRHADGTETLYGHMSRYARSSGTVKAGTVIGYVGATGNATGPHLHLEVRPDGGGLDDTVDPFEWLEDKGLEP